MIEHIQKDHRNIIFAGGLPLQNAYPVVLHAHWKQPCFLDKLTLEMRFPYLVFHAKKLLTVNYQVFMVQK